MNFAGGAFAGAGGWSNSEATQASYFDDDFWYGNGGCAGGTGQECDENGHIEAASVAAFDFTITGLHSFHVIIDLGAGLPTCEARMTMWDPNNDELFDYLAVGNTTPDDDIHTTWGDLLSNGTYHFDAHVSGESDGGSFGGAGFQYQITITRCIADFNLDGVVDFNDYLDFVDAYSMSDPSADVNGDSVVDLFDYLDFVDHFSTGC